MSVERELVEIEETLWKNDAKLYYDRLTDEALLVFPETGVIGREAAVDAILAENAGGKRRAHEAPYTALASSVYVKRDDAWKLALHQQSPLSQADAATASPTSA